MVEANLFKILHHNLPSPQWGRQHVTLKNAVFDSHTDLSSKPGSAVLKLLGNLRQVS